MNSAIFMAGTPALVDSDIDNAIGRCRHLVICRDRRAACPSPANFDPIRRDSGCVNQRVAYRVGAQMRQMGVVIFAADGVGAPDQGGNRSRVGIQICNDIGNDFLSVLADHRAIIGEADMKPNRIDPDRPDLFGRNHFAATAKQAKGGNDGKAAKRSPTIEHGCLHSGRCAERDMM